MAHLRPITPSPSNGGAPLPAARSAASTPDLVPLAEIAARLGLSTKSVRRLHHEEGLPLVRFTEGSRYHGFWSWIESWASTRVAPTKQGRDM